MATIQPGPTGKQYRNSTVVVAKLTAYPAVPLKPPKFVRIYCKTPKGDEQHGFPITVTLSHDEAVKLIAGIAKALAIPDPLPPRTPPPRKRFTGGASPSLRAKGLAK